MTGDEGLNVYLGNLQSIINELYTLASDIENNLNGVGESDCAATIRFVADTYNNIKIRISNEYYTDVSNNT